MFLKKAAMNKVDERLVVERRRAVEHYPKMRPASSVEDSVDDSSLACTCRKKAFVKTT